jgi:hypothetical protein
MTALMSIFRVKRPEIDEICCNSSSIGVNWLGFYKAQTDKLYSPVNLWTTRNKLPKKIAYYLYIHMFKEIYVWMGGNSFKYKTSEICNNIIARKGEACPSKISHKFHKQCLFNFLQNVRPILVVSKYPPLLDTTLLIYSFGLSPFRILVTIPLLE